MGQSLPTTRICQPVLRDFCCLQNQLWKSFWKSFWKCQHSTGSHELACHHPHCRWRTTPGIHQPIQTERRSCQIQWNQRRHHSYLLLLDRNPGRDMQQVQAMDNVPLPSSAGTKRLPTSISRGRSPEKSLWCTKDQLPKTHTLTLPITLRPHAQVMIQTPWTLMPWTSPQSKGAAAFETACASSVNNWTVPLGTTLVRKPLLAPLTILKGPDQLQPHLSPHPTSWIWGSM